MSEEQRKRNEETRLEMKRRKLHRAILDRYRKQHEATWEPLRASAMMARRTLIAMTIVTTDVARWVIAMEAIIDEAIVTMRERMCQEDANPGWRFWYDFDPDVAAAAREHVKKYPGSNCPLIIL